MLLRACREFVTAVVTSVANVLGLGRAFPAGPVVENLDSSLSALEHFARGAYRTFGRRCPLGFHALDSTRARKSPARVTGPESPCSLLVIVRERIQEGFPVGLRSLLGLGVFRRLLNQFRNRPAIRRQAGRYSGGRLERAVALAEIVMSEVQPVSLIEFGISSRAGQEDSPRPLARAGRMRA